MRRALNLLNQVFLAVLLAAGCADVPVEETEPGVELAVYALSGTCSTTEAVGAVQKYRITVVDNSDGKGTVVEDREFDAASETLKLKGIPQSTNLELTMLGLAEGSDRPVVFGRARNLQVTKNESTQVYLTLGRYGDYSCVDVPSGTPNMVFPTVTTLPDGRVLIAGGFTKVSEAAGSFEIYNPSDRAYIYDPATGEMRQASNIMNQARGAHSAIYMPSGKVMLVGGVDRLFMEKDSGDSFPWYYLKDKAGTVGRTYELFDVDTERFLKLEEDWPDEGNELFKQVRRVFPALALNNDGSVLVTGGGQWHSIRTDVEADSDYQVAELYLPATEESPGYFADTSGALSMLGMRAGHSAVLMDVRDKLAYTLFWGGSADGPIAEYYVESSDQASGNWGIFKELSFVDAAAYKRRPYFHTMTPLGNREFLLVGGVNAKTGALDKVGELDLPSASEAYLVKIDDDLRASVAPVSGLGEGRYFHNTVSYDAQHVMVFGGFGTTTVGEDKVFSPNAMDDMRFYYTVEKTFVERVDSKDGAPLPRAGVGAIALGNDCYLMVGGMDHPAESLEFGNISVGLVAEQFCASMVCPESLWNTGCYAN